MAAKLLSQKRFADCASHRLSSLVTMIITTPIETELRHLWKLRTVTLDLWKLRTATPTELSTATLMKTEDCGPYGN